MRDRATTSRQVNSGRRCRRLTGDDLGKSPGVTVVTNCTVEWSGTIYPSTKGEILSHDHRTRVRVFVDYLCQKPTLIGSLVYPVNV